MRPIQIVTLSPLRDSRGSLTEIFRQEWVNSAIPVQWNCVQSETNVLRGVHVHVKHTVTIPKAQYADASILALSFIAESPVRPVDLGISIDPRLLGMGLVSLRLSTVQLPRRRALMKECACRLKSVAY
jgi:hypothetical protein